VLPYFLDGSQLLDSATQAVQVSTYIRDNLASQYPVLRDKYTAINHTQCSNQSSNSSATHMLSSLAESDSGTVIELVAAPCTKELTSTSSLIGITSENPKALGEENVCRCNCSPVLVFELPPLGCNTLPSPCIALPCSLGKSQYHLSAIIDHGEYHFCARLFVNNKEMWNYDGQINHGIPVLEIATFDSWHNECTSLPSLLIYGSKRAHIYLYVLVGIEYGCSLL